MGLDLIKSKLKNFPKIETGKIGSQKTTQDLINVNLDKKVAQLLEFYSATTVSTVAVRILR